MDDTDIKILTILQESSNITNLELSKTIGLSTASTLDRVKKIHAARLISGYHASINQNVLGFTIECILLVTLQNHQQETIDTFINKVKRIDRIIECKRTIGSSDFFLKAIARHPEDFEIKVLDGLSKYKEIEKISVLTTTNTIKDGKKINLNHSLLNS